MAPALLAAGLRRLKSSARQCKQRENSTSVAAGSPASGAHGRGLLAFVVAAEVVLSRGLGVGAGVSLGVGCGPVAQREWLSKAPRALLRIGVA